MATRNGSVFDGTYSFSSRFEEGEGTNPEELIRAPAHVHLRNVDGAPTIELAARLA